MSTTEPTPSPPNNLSPIRPPSADSREAQSRPPPLTPTSGNVVFNADADADNDNEDGPVGPTPSNSRGSMSSFLFMTIMLFMLTNNGGEDILVRNQYRESLRVLRSQQRNFSAWIVNEESNFTLPLPDTNCSELAHSAMAFGVPPNPLLASYYSNVTGFMEGDATFFNLSGHVTPSPGSKDILPSTGKPTLNSPWTSHIPSYLTNFNATDALERMGAWNWSASTHVQWRVLESTPDTDDVKKKLEQAAAEGDEETRHLTQLLGDISLLHGRVELLNLETDEELDLDMEAVHFLSNGTIYGLAEPLGHHVDVRDLPSLVPSKYVNATAQAINIELLARIKRLQYMVDSGVVEIDSANQENSVKTTCPFTLFAQLVPTSVPLHLMRELESEMEKPTGVSTVERPDMIVNALLVSKECGIMYEVKDAEGLQSPRFWRKVTSYAAFTTIVYLALLVLFIRQNEISQTPLGVSRLSRWTFLAQGVADSISFVGHTTFGVLAEGQPSMSLIAPAFLACILTIYEAHLSVTIHQIQAPEDNVPTQPIPTPAPPQTTQQPQPENVEGRLQARPQPNPTTPNPSPQPEPGFMSQLWRHMREHPQTRLFLALLLVLTLFLRILASPNLALFFTGIVYSSFWLPQIVRSARRGTSSGLKAEYLIGTITLRGGLAIYLFGYPKNVLGITPSPWIFLIIGFSFFQVFVLILQEFFGPAFFLPKSYSHTKQYDYHPPIPIPDTEAPEHSVGDCVICMEPIDVHADKRRSSVSSDRHSFHIDRQSIDKGKEKEKEKKIERARAHSRSRSKTRSRELAYLHNRPGGITPLARLRLRALAYVSDWIEALRNGLQAAGRSTGATRRVYALAPCGHLFHTACLERWLAIKNLCPQCRRPLPPL